MELNKRYEVDGERSLMFIKRPDLWVACGGFVCPLRMEGKAFEDGGLGYLVQGGGYRVTVGIMGMPQKSDTTRSYVTAEDVVDDGWVVD